MSEQELFDDMINEYKKLDLMDKRNELLNSIKDLIVSIELLADQDNVLLKYLKSDEILDIKSSNREDDFLEAELVYIENAKNLLAQYLDQRSLL